MALFTRSLLSRLRTSREPMLGIFKDGV